MEWHGTLIPEKWGVFERGSQWISKEGQGLIQWGGGTKCPRFWTISPLNLGKMTPFAPMCSYKYGQNAPDMPPKWPYLKGKCSKFSGGGQSNPNKYIMVASSLPFRCYPQWPMRVVNMPSDLAPPPQFRFSGSAS